MTKRPLDYWILWILVMSLAMGNIWFGKRLLEAKRGTSHFLGNVSGAISEIQKQELSYRVSINQKVPFSAIIAVKDTLVVPLKTSIPVNTVVEVPFKLPLVGTTYVQVPIQTTVPIDLDIALNIQKDIPVEGTTSLGLTVPIEIKDIPFGDAFEKINILLRQLRVDLN